MLKLDRKFQLKVYKTARARGQWDNGFLGSAKHLSGEVLEVVNAYTYPSDYSDVTHGVGLELADVVLNALSIAEYLEIDLSECIKEKQLINEERADNGK